MSRPLILLVGGRSTEHDASLHGYRAILRAAQEEPDRFRLDGVVFISREGSIRIFQAKPWPDSEESLIAGERISFDRAIKKMKAPDVFVFSLLHGNEGEDGAWQGVAEIFDITGNFGPILPSALGMNKYLQALLAVSVVPGLRVPQTWPVRPPVSDARYMAILRELNLRGAVVKPNSMGASLLSVFLLRPDVSSLKRAAEDIFGYDHEVLVQEYINGQEYTCGVFREDDHLIALPVIEAQTPQNFLGHREKHEHGLVRAVVHDVDDEVVRMVKAASLTLFTEMNMFGFARFDYLFDDSLFFLEVNTLPGLMSGSAFPRMLESGGRTLGDLIEATAREAISAPRRRKFLPYTIHH